MLVLQAAKSVFRDLSEEHSPAPETQDEQEPATKKLAVQMTRDEFEQRIQSAMEKVTDKPAPELDVRIACRQATHHHTPTLDTPKEAVLLLSS